ncbi:hypothetical protein SRABI96_00944 [Peribacillus sp. Bi96]|nr:hypothetical protein SRABI96_00944 [Peribacillus sp. Bi96]
MVDFDITTQIAKRYLKRAWFCSKNLFEDFSTKYSIELFNKILNITKPLSTLQVHRRLSQLIRGNGHLIERFVNFIEYIIQFCHFFGDIYILLFY